MQSKLEQLQEDLTTARELLLKASQALAFGTEAARIDTANEIDGFLDVVRCSVCGVQIQHAGFLCDDGTCGSCDDARSPGDKRAPRYG